MKRIIFSIFIILFLASCRKEGDYFMNPNDYEVALGSRTAVSVTAFEQIWSSINTGYSFWDITDVDWDQRYEEYKPKFEEIDRELMTYSTSNPADLKEYIKHLQVLYDGLLDGLVDGHMVVMAGFNDSLRTATMPSAKRNSSRAHKDDCAQNFRSTFLVDLAKNGNVTGFDSCYFCYAKNHYAGHASCVYTLSDGRKVPYLWNSDFVDASTIQSFIKTGVDPEALANAIKWQPIYNNFIDNLINTPKSQIGGVILDLRADGGGSMSSLPNYINIFAGEEHTYWETRYKEGMGRYDMSAWIPLRIGMPERHRDLAAENIPIVVLCDVNSVSCAEITTGSIKQMPTAHVIGERTWGGHGPLLGQNNYEFNQTYGGVSGSMDMLLGYFVYTANFENRLAGGQILEGVGISPDEEVLYKDAGYQGQFDAAIKYLENKK